jgi:poly(ADP-ribose) glycohydrolase ARH3
LGDVARLGNGMVALESVPTAVACFTLYPGSYEQAVGSAILLGGDTDTIAAMTGAVSGAFRGIRAIPQHLLDGLEDQGKGKTYLLELARKLHRVTLPQSDRVAV